MSELKVYHHELRHNEYEEFYLKYEADKFIAELEETHKMEVEQLLIFNREQANSANRLRDDMERVIRHQKRKRCLAMAKICENKLGTVVKPKWWDKWRKRWLSMADKFKDKEA